MIDHGILKSHDIFHYTEELSFGIDGEGMCKGCRGQVK